MLQPDVQFALDMLDALDERCSLRINRHVYGLEGRRERCWAEQQVQMIAVLQDWLEREASGSQLDDPLCQAAGVLCDGLARSRDLLRQNIEEIDVATTQTQRRRGRATRPRTPPSLNE